MSGHSKWSKLKHFKGALDAKKSSLFSKITQMITVAAREGNDPEMNFKLRLAIEKAKDINMPKENIERAIKRGAGETGTIIEEVTYEAFGPSGVALIIEAVTDNKNRTSGDLRRILNRCEGSLAGANSVLWQFSRSGVLRIKNEKIKNKDESEKIELLAIEAGAQDISQTDEDELTIHTKPEELQKVKEELEKNQIRVDYTDLEWFSESPIKISKDAQKKIDALFAEFDENTDISDYYSNIE